ncbi:30S ribosomal protein S15 [Hirschfeldia incana]|nr:30S ribosomal protein S15 [Hirschfeldia incana]
MALLLARRQRRFPSLIRFFSNSPSDPPPKPANASLEKPLQSLNQKSTQAKNQRSRGPLQDLTINLAKFQRRSAAPPPKGVPPSISFEALYKQKVGANSSNRRGQEVNDGRSREGETEEMVITTEFVKVYREDELGEKLRMLRPEGKKKGEGWFSLEELSERLVKLRQVEEREVVKNQRGSFSVLRNVIGTLEEDEKAKNEAISLQNLDVLGYLDGTPEYKQYPPKDELVETIICHLRRR